MSAEILPRLPITVPQLGVGEETVRVSSWLVDVGQFLVTNDRVAEVLAPGITFDIEAGQTGELLEIVKPVGSVVVPGEIIGWVKNASNLDPD